MDLAVCLHLAKAASEFVPEPRRRVDGQGNPVDWLWERDEHVVAAVVVEADDRLANPPLRFPLPEKLLLQFKRRLAIRQC